MTVLYIQCNLFIWKKNFFGFVFQCSEITGLMHGPKDTIVLAVFGPCGAKVYLGTSVVLGDLQSCSQKCSENHVMLKIELGCDVFKICDLTSVLYLWPPKTLAFIKKINITHTTVAVD